MDNNIDDQPTVEVIDVTPEPADGHETPVEDTSGATVMMDLESMIKTAITAIDQKKNELRKLNDMTNSFLSQDPTYQEHEKAAKEAARIKNQTKSELLKQPAVAQTIDKAKELKKELKETQDGLSEYLREYQRISGSNEIEDNNGDVREIIYFAKLIRRGGKFAK